MAVITGGGSGIGLALVERFSAEGAAVVVADLSGRRAAQVAGSLPRAVAVKGDVSVPEDAERDRHPQPCRPISRDRHLGEQRRLLHLGVSDFDASRGVGPRLCRQRTGRVSVPEVRLAVAPENGEVGVVLFTASTDALQGSVGQLAYASSKAAIWLATWTMALDHGPHGVRVNCVCPGATATPPMVAMMESALKRCSGALLDRVPYCVGSSHPKRWPMPSSSWPPT